MTRRRSSSCGGRAARHGSRRLPILREEMSAVGLDPDVGRRARGSHRRRTPRARSSSARRRSASTAATYSRPTASRSGLTCRVYRLRDGRISPLPDRADLRADACKRDRRRWPTDGQSDRDQGGRARAGARAARHRGKRPGAADAGRGAGDRGPVDLQPLPLRARLARSAGPGRRATTRPAGSAFWPSTPTTRSAIPTTRSRRCASGSARRTGRSRTCTTKARGRRAIGPPRSRRTSTCSTRICGSATRALPTPTTWTPRLDAAWLREALDERVERARDQPCRDRARRLLDQMEAMT